MNNQWFGIRLGILIYSISCFFNPAFTEILPSKLLDNTEWVLKSEDCQHDTVSSYEFNFNFRVFKNRVEMSGTWENDGGNSGDTRAFGTFNGKTGVLNLKNRRWEFKGKFYPKENTTFFKGKFSDHPLDCEIIEGHIKNKKRDLYAEARKNSTAKIASKTGFPVKLSSNDRSNLKTLVYTKTLFAPSGFPKTDNVKYKISNISPYKIEFDNGTMLYANFIQNGGKPYSPGHSNLDTFIIDKEKINSGFLDASKGTTMSYRVQEEWNNDYGMQWQLEATIVGLKTVLINGVRVKAVVVKVRGESIEQTISSSWAEEGIKFREKLFIHPKLKIILKFERIWENTTSNSPPKVQIMTLKEYRLKNGELVSLADLSKSMVASTKTRVETLSKRQRQALFRRGVKIGKLSEDEIRVLFSGDIKAWAIVRGKKYFVRYYPGGTLNIDGENGRFSIAGRWWVENRKWCRSRPKVRNKCFDLSIPRNPGSSGNWKSVYALDFIGRGMKPSRVWIESGIPEKRILQFRRDKDRNIAAQKKIILEKKFKAAAEAKRVADKIRRLAIAKAKKKAAELKRLKKLEQATKLRNLRKQLEDAKRKAAEVEKQKAVTKALQRATEEARRKAAKESMRRAKAQAKQKAAEETRRLAIVEAKRKAAEALAEANRRAAEEARQKAVAEALRRAEEESKRRVEAEARQKAAEEARRLAVAEAKRKAEEAVAEAKRKAAEAIAEVKRKLLAEARRKALVEAKRKAAEEARRKALAEAAQKLDWRNKGRPIDKGLKQRNFGKRVVILLPAENILELKAERNSFGRVSGLRVLAGCRYDNGILMNFLGSAVGVGGFDLVSDKVNLFGNNGNKIRFTFQRNVYPDRFIQFKGLNSNSVTIAGWSNHNRYKNGQVRTDLSKRDKEFFINNYGCLAQRKNLKVVLRKGDLRFLASNKKFMFQSSDILIWPFTLREDPMDPNTKSKGVKVEFD